MTREQLLAELLTERFGPFEQVADEQIANEQIANERITAPAPVPVHEAHRNQRLLKAIHRYATTPGGPA